MVNIYRMSGVQVSNFVSESFGLSLDRVCKSSRRRKEVSCTAASHVSSSWLDEQPSDPAFWRKSLAFVIFGVGLPVLYTVAYPQRSEHKTIRPK